MTLAVLYDSLLSPGLLLPATVPIAVTLAVVAWVGHHRRRVRRAGLADAPVSDSRVPAAHRARRMCAQHASARHASLAQRPARTPAP
jgi:hypothetical protein